MHENTASIILFHWAVNGLHDEKRAHYFSEIENSLNNFVVVILLFPSPCFEVLCNFK